jgi:hypothetical protein
MRRAVVCRLMSQPSWAAWIEISVLFLPSVPYLSQPSWAAWIEIYMHLATPSTRFCRSPLGLRGLKYGWGLYFAADRKMSQPSWAAWIEIIDISDAELALAGRSPLGLRGLKSKAARYMKGGAASQPSWAAWIEIARPQILLALCAVAALLGCVD